MVRPLIAALLFLLAPAAAAAPDEAAYASVNAALVEHHVLPRYERLAKATADFAAAADAYCAEPAAERLEQLRGGFHDAMDAWMGIQHIRFGPAELFMRAYRLHFWPQVQGKLDDAVHEALAALEKAAPTPEEFEHQSVAVQGLPAAEYLIFVDGLQDGEAGCTLLVALSRNMQRMADEIVAEWRGGDIAFARLMATPGPKNPYFETHKDATLALFRSLHDELQLIADVKLMPIVGENVDAAGPQLVEAGPSKRSLRNIVRNLEALQALYLGEGGAGLAELAAASSDAKLDPLLRKAFPMTIATAEGIDAPLAKAVTDAAERPEAEKLKTQVLALKQIVKTRLADALDLGVGFNALDGD